MAALLSLGRCGDFTRSRAYRRRVHTHPLASIHPARTFRPRKAAPAQLYTQLKQHIDATIGSGNLRDAVRARWLLAPHVPLFTSRVLTWQVQLPPGEDLNEWCGPSCVYARRSRRVWRGDSTSVLWYCRLAVNTVDFFNAISMLYGTLTECCTAESCPTMCAGPKYEYRWADGVKVRGVPAVGADVVHACS